MCRSSIHIFVLAHIKFVCKIRGNCNAKFFELLQHAKEPDSLAGQGNVHYESFANRFSKKCLDFGNTKSSPP